MIANYYCDCLMTFNLIDNSIIIIIQVGTIVCDNIILVVINMEMENGKYITSE